MNILIIYYSHSGNNEKLAKYLSERLNCNIQRITEEKDRKTISILFDFILKSDSKLSATDIKVDDFDMIIFASPIWGGRPSTPIRTFMDREKEHIKKYSFISFCNGEADQKEKLINELTAIIKSPPAICTELSINKLLPLEKQNKIKYTFNYRVLDEDLEHFKDETESFVKVIEECGNVI